MERRTLRDLFGNPRALEAFLKDMAQTVTMSSGLPIISNPESRFEMKVITLPDLPLWGLPDTPETRDRLIKLVNGAVQDFIQLKSISALSTEGIRFEVERSSGTLSYQLVAQVWH